MSPRALSIAAASAEQPDAAALIDERGVTTFAALAAEVAATRTGVPLPPDDRAAPLVAAIDRATVIAILAALEDRTPIGLIPARATPAEQAALRERLAAAPLAPDTLAVVFTSGSTGRPKGVVLSRTAALAAADASGARLGWRKDDRWLLALPLAHVSGLGIVVRCLQARRAMVLAGPSLADTLATRGVTLASLVPAQLAGLLADPAWSPPPGLRAVLLGGAAAAPALVAAARARGVAVHTTYGMTETFGQVATGDATTPLGAVGPPLPGVIIRTGSRARPQPIVVDSPALLTGYLDDPSPTLDDGFVTRDLGFVDGGVLHVVGRTDDVIITGGENVHPLAIEAALVELPGVAAAAVVGVDDDLWGQLLAALIVPAPGVEPAAIEAAVRAANPGWPPHRRVRRIELVDALPLGPSGKLDRRAAAARFRTASPRPAGSAGPS